jgi:hypothetical protein
MIRKVLVECRIQVSRDGERCLTACNCFNYAAGWPDEWCRLGGESVAIEDRTRTATCLDAEAAAKGGKA